MIVALSYLMTAITISLLLAITKSSGHELKPDSEVFRYQQGRIQLVLFCAPIPIICGVVIYLVTTPRMTGISLAFLAALSASATVASLFAYRSFKAFAVEANKDSLLIHRGEKVQILHYDQIKEINLIEGGKGSLTLSVLDANRKKLFELSNSMEDLRGLSGLIRTNACKLGASYKYRDRWGHWS